MPRIEIRSCPDKLRQNLERNGISPQWARLLAARGVADPTEVTHRLANLLPPDSLLNSARAAELLADAIEEGKRLLIVADYDADGATACATGVRGLRMLGACVDYLVPNRMEHGYGLSPAIVHLAAARRPDLLITVDNGIAAVEGIAEAKRLGIPVLVTDHHLAGETLPEALCIVNPNQPNCGFPSKHLAGVGVVFYVLLALRAELRRRGRFAGSAEPDLRQLLDLVALGTIADVVRLDANNRTLVAQGLARIRSGAESPGIEALFRVASSDPRNATVFDLGFKLGPRLNAAGRIDDMALGIECLLADDAGTAMSLAQQLDALNHTRRSVESDMLDEALAILATFDAGDSATITTYQADWHAGVIGILASRLKDRFHRPTVVFARGEDGLLKGSGRSIPALHLRDALDLVDKRQPGIIRQFGGHAMAAGLTLTGDDPRPFAMAFERVARELLSPADLHGVIETDGELDPAAHTFGFAREIENGIWGQGFPAPLFVGEFDTLEQRVIKEKHLKLRLQRRGERYDAMHFFHAEVLPPKIRAVYGLMSNEFNGVRAVQLKLHHWEPAACR